jgi:hypothetical protein
MPGSEPEPKSPEPKSFWSTFPGLLTAIGGIIAATAALLTALVSAGVIGNEKPTPAPPPVTAPATATLPPTVTAAPSAPTATASPQASATPTPDGVLLEDDFSTERNGWLSEVTDKDEKGYEGGEFRIAVYDPEYSTWGYPEPPLDLADFVAEVDARRVSGPLENEYGVMVRYQQGIDDFYLFAISSSGSYVVEKYVGGEWQTLVEWTESPVIQSGDASNRLRVTCQGSKMRFFVNGEQLTQIEDTSFRSGNIGLLVSTLDKGGAVVAFDNLRVRALSAP